MASFSKIIIVGNVGRDPELKMTPNGRPVCEFSVAVNRVTGKTIREVLADDPLLTDRSGSPRRRPLLRVIVDSRLRLPMESRVVGTAHGDVLVVDAHVERQLANVPRSDLIDERLMEVRIEPLAVHGRRDRGRQTSWRNRST